jgi:hypothetical protein
MKNAAHPAVKRRRKRIGQVSSLLLKHASASRPSGEWNDDDYDVLPTVPSSAVS